MSQLDQCSCQPSWLATCDASTRVFRPPNPWGWWPPVWSYSQQWCYRAQDLLEIFNKLSTLATSRLKCCQVELIYFKLVSLSEWVSESFSVSMSVGVCVSVHVSVCGSDRVNEWVRERVQCDCTPACLQSCKLKFLSDCGLCWLVSVNFEVQIQRFADRYSCIHYWSQHQQHCTLEIQLCARCGYQLNSNRTSALAAGVSVDQRGQLVFR